MREGSDDAVPLTRPSLLARIRDLNDQDAWSQFTTIYAPVIHAYLRRRGLQDADAADVAQETLHKVTRAIRHLDYDRGKGRFRGWLLTVTRHTLIDHVNRARRAVAGTGDTTVMRLLSEQPDDSDAQDWERSCQEQVVRCAMEHVRQEFEPPTWRAFYATVVEDRPPAEVADELDVSVGAVYVAKSRVTGRLRRVIAELESDD